MEGDGVAAVADIRATQRAGEDRAPAVNWVASATGDRQGPSYDRRVAAAARRRLVYDRVLSACGPSEARSRRARARGGGPPAQSRKAAVALHGTSFIRCAAQ